MDLELEDYVNKREDIVIYNNIKNNKEVIKLLVVNDGDENSKKKGCEVTIVLDTVVKKQAMKSTTSIKIK